MIKEFRVGGIFGQSLSVLFANFVPFLVITTLVHLPMIAYECWFAANPGDWATPKDLEIARGRKGILVGVIDLILGPIATGAVTFGVLQQLRGKRASIGHCLFVGVSRLLPVIGVAICVGLLVGLGTLLFIIPGIILTCMYFVAVPAAVVERSGVGGALSRSYDLTQGFRFHILGLWFLLFIVQAIVYVALIFVFIDPTSTQTSQTGYATMQLVFVPVSLVLSAWGSCACAIAYYHLRSIKESVDVDEVASVFD
jgi:hypothetical protein